MGSRGLGETGRRRGLKSQGDDVELRDELMRILKPRSRRWLSFEPLTTATQNYGQFGYRAQLPELPNINSGNRICYPNKISGSAGSGISDPGPGISGSGNGQRVICPELITELIGSKDSSRKLQADCAINCFRLYLMFYAYVQRFDVTRNLENFWN